jgi:aryl-alcohol dehydrogenase-like predicted oxidoreductase
MSAPPRRALGRSDLKVAPFALGGNVFGWTVNEKTGFRLLDDFVSAGFNLIDTADVYSSRVAGQHGSESERLIGRWLRESGRRRDVLIATKVGMDMGNGRTGLGRHHIESSVEESLKRLQTDVIDLYQAHIDDPATPLEETLRAFDHLKTTGKVRAIGASNYGADRLAEALETSERLGLARFESLQPKYNLMDRGEFEGPLESVCRKHELGVLTFSSLASGFLTGKYRSEADLSKSPRGVRVQARLGERGFRILQALDDVASRLDAAPSTVALAWLMAHPIVTAPIASATSEVQLQELLQAASLHLDSSAMQQLDGASA